MISIQKNITLIPIKAEDQTQLFELMDEVYKTAYSHFWKDGGNWYIDLIYSKKNLEKELSRESSHYFFVEFDQEKIGILKYDFPFSPKQIEIPNSMKLHRLYLHPKVHGKGIAQALMQHIEEVAMENKLDYIWLEAMESQPQARRFYEKSGYAHCLTYTLDFEQLLPEYRGIQILKKNLS
ncbi:GNAT family N-acetyltransferase [Algoriphagus sp. CAU 1675]|uniref:GNAT family N-acetyltransferase n=1 Tax=Algoriphagus sp. CAU 1675 TaxID=3032597 RepID=UPI0023DC4A20|nr:GNAT family N-acetyltransferase [Algoriphagus sp. CAU 1675]MDF2159353.1 GNAT family N-acetyltransferase [Algoriphagus sp. CAU 1675]